MCDQQAGACEGASKPASLCVDGVWAACTAAVYEAHSASYQEASEATCDGVDNDCDGQIDEDFQLELPDGTVVSGVGKGCGAGACGGGVTTCADSGEGVTCSSLDAASVEVCNGVDDDCDGLTDAQEADLSATDPQICERQFGVCAGARKAASLCVDGAWRACSATVYAGHSVLYEDSEEQRCDGFDNDCDGEVDNSFVVITLDGGVVVGAGQPCGAGACAGGVTICLSGGDGIACGSEVMAAPEACDGADDDCDGLTDAADPDLGLEPCAEQRGACEGVRHGAMECVEGSWEACAASQYLAQEGYEGDAELSCDGVDNDCDGDTDEDFDWLDPVDGQTKHKGAPCGAGECAGSIVVCGADGESLTCSSEGGTEVCGDDVDNDCDGDTDEMGAQGCAVFHKDADGDGHGVDGDARCLCAPQPSGPYDALGGGDCDDGDAAVRPDATEVCNSVDDDCDGLTDADDVADLDAGAAPACELQLGVCAGALKPVSLCVDGAWLACAVAIYTAHSAHYEAATELTCDGRDNDCDGQRDEDFSWASPDGSARQGVGMACGIGVCAGGATVCTDEKDGITCSSLDLATQEVCNGTDDDCDGLTDGDDDSLLRTQCSLQAGVCAGALRPAENCNGGAWSACDDGAYMAHAGVYQAGMELTCEGLDNDCDGDADEDFSATTPDGAVAVGAGAACGVGRCAGGTTRCDDLQLGILCDTAALAQAEACDSLDDDCDGLTDAEDPDLVGDAATPCELQGGVCAGAMKPASLCQDGTWAVCDDAIYLAHHDGYAPLDRTGDRCFGWDVLDVSLVGPKRRDGRRPHVAVADDGHWYVAHASSQDDTLLVTHAAPGATPVTEWIAPQDSTLREADIALVAGLPVLAFVDDARAVAGFASRSVDGSWATEVLLLSAEGSIVTPRIEVATDGVVHVLFGLDEEGEVVRFVRALDRSWRGPELLWTGTVDGIDTAIDAAGRPIVAVDAGASTLRLLEQDGVTWSASTVRDDYADLDAVALEIDGRGRLHLATFDDSSGRTDYLHELAAGWSQEAVALDMDARMGLALDANGSAHLSLTHAPPDADDVLYHATNASGVWETSEIISGGAGAHNDLAVHADEVWIAFRHDVPQALELARLTCSASASTEDENCDGVDGMDADGDGVGDAAYLGADCDDQDATINPAAADTVGDATDSDCDGSDGEDEDADRSASVASGGGDCDDADPYLNPGMIERCNELDDDCNGLTDAEDAQLSAGGPPACERQDGVCAGATKPTSLCVDGAWLACDADTYAAHDARYSDWDVVGQPCIAWADDVNLSLGDESSFVSVAVDESGTPHIARFDRTSSSLVYSTTTGSSLSQLTVDSSGKNGYWPSVAVHGTDVAIAYQAQSAGALRIARVGGGVVSIGPSGWSVEAPDTGASDGGHAARAIFDTMGVLHVMHVDTSANQIRYLRERGDAWHVQALTGTNVGERWWTLGLAVDEGQHVHACYDRGAEGIFYVTNRLGAFVETRISADAASYCDVEVDAQGYARVAFATAGATAEIFVARETASGWSLESAYPSMTGAALALELLIDEAGRSRIAFVADGDIKLANDVLGAWTTQTVATDILSGGPANLPIKDGLARLGLAWDAASWASTGAYELAMGLADASDGRFVRLSCDDQPALIDSNCDGVDGVDGDGDGDADWDRYGDDCRDDQALVHPNQADACDGLDDDCDQLVDEYLPDALATETIATGAYSESDACRLPDGRLAVASLEPGGQEVTLRVETGSGAWGATSVDAGAHYEGVLAACDPWGVVHVVFRDVDQARLVHSVHDTTVALTAVGAGLTVGDITAEGDPVSPALTLDRFGRPWVSYKRQSDNHLMVGVQDSGGWTTSAVAYMGYGAASAIAIDARDLPVIAHELINFWRSSARVAWWGTGGTGGPNQGWQVSTIEGAYYKSVGASIQIAREGDGYHVAYRDLLGDVLRYARNPSSMGAGSWSITNVSQGDQANGLGNRLFVDPAGVVHLATRRDDTGHLEYWTRRDTTWKQALLLDDASYHQPFGLIIDPIRRSPIFSVARQTSPAALQVIRAVCN
jgi:hypothetical protein